MEDDWLFSLIEEEAAKSNIDLTEEMLSDLIQKLLDDSHTGLYKILESRRVEHVSIRREETAAFEARLRTRWELAFSLMETIVLLSEEAGKLSYDEDIEQNINNPLFEVLHKFHARAVQISKEILHLLKSGFSDGAMARWRSLHELTVIAYFIKDKGIETAQRFLDHEHIINFKEARCYNENSRKLGLTELTTTELEHLNRQNELMLHKYGMNFKEDYGWAAHAIKGKPNFAQIEKEVELNHLRPYYKLANNIVHSGVKSITFKLGLINNRKMNEVLLTGSTNYGLAEPGQSSVISLNQMTVNLLTYSPTFERLAYLKVIAKFVEKCKSAFVHIQKDLEEETMNP